MRLVVAILFACLLLPSVAPAQMITNEDLEKKYGPSTDTTTPEQAAQDIERRREENAQALQDLNCTELKAAGTRRALARYRKECLTPEERKAYDEKVRRRCWRKSKRGRFR